MSWHEIEAEDGMVVQVFTDDPALLSANVPAGAKVKKAKHEQVPTPEKKK